MNRTAPVFIGCRCIFAMAVIRIGIKLPDMRYLPPKVYQRNICNTRSIFKIDLHSTSVFCIKPLTEQYRRLYRTYNFNSRKATEKTLITAARYQCKWRGGGIKMFSRWRLNVYRRRIRRPSRLRGEMSDSGCGREF